MIDLWKNCNRLERLLIVLSASLFVGSIVVLSMFEKLFIKEILHPDDVIAQVISASSETKRRMPSSFQFRNIDDSNKIGNGDSIFVGENSKLLIEFKNKGSKLVIGEQTLVVLREVNGKVDLILEKGAASGTLAEGDEIMVKTDEDTIMVNGEKEAQFTVSKMPDLGLALQGFEKDVFVSYRGQKESIKNKGVVINRENGITFDEGTDNPNGRIRDTASTQPPPKGVKINDEAILKDKALQLSAPYPVENMVFLHSKGGQVPIFPKSDCLDGCTLKISLNGKKSLERTFEKNQVPLVYIGVEKNIEADVTWEFKDGPVPTNGSFQVKVKNDANFKNAFAEKRAIEVMN